MPGHLTACLRTLLAWACVLLSLPACAGELTQADVARHFPPPLKVGNKATDLPVWPISNELTPDAGPVAWAFESEDLAPIPGFEGTPINLLVSVDTQGNFRDVELLRQHEPVFVGGLGEAPLRDFLKQYAGLNLGQEITVSSVYGQRQQAHPQTESRRVVLDGVTKATASVRIANQTVLTAALAVGRARLGLTPPRQTQPAEVRQDEYAPRSFQQLLADGSIGHLHVSNRQIEELFAGTDVAGLDPDALADPDATYLDLYVAYLNAPTIGRAILGDAGFTRLQQHLNAGQHAWWVASAGRAELIGPDFVPGTAPAHLALHQDGAPLELRDLDFEPPPPVGAPALTGALVLRIAEMSGLDPASVQSFSYHATRAKGQILPEVIERTLTLSYQPPEDYFDRPPPPPPAWLQAWHERRTDLIIITGALALLTVVLLRPAALSRSVRSLRLFRWTFLAFTLIFIGWYAQGQLSIVQLTGAIKTLHAGQNLSSFLYDPVTLLILAFTAISFFIWGRGTFCGWLCPFGALQEFSALIGRRCGLRARRLPPKLARSLSGGRYVLLAVLLIGAAIAPRATEFLVELEPFKTTITVGFVRAWPFVAYAVILLGLSAVYYKFFCRYLCPLGAAMTIGGKLRLWRWLPRREACGQPCQTCRARCHYDAIAPSGEIHYDACFQCLDCVGIFHDENRCAPLLLFQRKGRRVTPRPSPQLVAVTRTDKNRQMTQNGTATAVNTVNQDAAGP